jgi:hypothetical protein
MRWISEDGAVEVIQSSAGSMSAVVKLDDGDLELQFARLDDTRLIGQVGHSDTLEVVGVQVLADTPALRVTWSRLRPWEARPVDSRQWEAWRVLGGVAS